VDSTRVPQFGQASFSRSSSEVLNSPEHNTGRLMFGPVGFCACGSETEPQDPQFLVLITTAARTVRSAGSGWSGLSLACERAGMFPPPCVASATQPAAPGRAAVLWRLRPVPAHRADRLLPHISSVGARTVPLPRRTGQCRLQQLTLSSRPEPISRSLPESRAERRAKIPTAGLIDRDRSDPRSTYGGRRPR
jgi:hypothetical protein